MTNMQVTWSQRTPYLDVNVKEEGGVYKIIRKTEKGDFVVFYVGMTDNLRRRLNEHFSDDEDNTCIKNKLKDYSCYFRYAYIGTQKERECAEAFLYKTYSIEEDGPPCNKKKPDAVPCEINLN